MAVKELSAKDSDRVTETVTDKEIKPFSSRGWASWFGPDGKPLPVPNRRPGSDKSSSGRITGL